MVDVAFIQAAQKSMDEKAIMQIVETFTPLVKNRASKLSRQYAGVDFDDLVQEGRLAIFRCFLSYRQKGRTFGFYSYIKLVVERRMKRFIFKTFRNVRRPEPFCVKNYIHEDINFGVSEVSHFFSI